MDKKIFTINLYGYLDEDKSKICKEYQDWNKSLIEKFPELGFEYKLVDITKEQEDFLKDNTELFELSNKHKFQMISDYVRYEYLKNNPGSIFIDTDFVLFGRDSLLELDVLRNISIRNGIDWTAGEMGRHGQHSCNWLMISGGGDNSLCSQLSNLLVEKSNKDSITNWKLNNKRKGLEEIQILNHSNSQESSIKNFISSESDEDYERRMVFDLFWGYKLYEYVNPSDYLQIPFYNWQGYFWNGSWTDTNVIHPDKILGCHFFGFAEERPDIIEFLKYHNIKRFYNDGREE